MTALPTFDVIVFSGGGFKGAYGAGAAKALMTYYQHKNITRDVCFVGNSAGALNAAVMAAGTVDDLISFWLQVTREDILGNGSASFWGLLSTYAAWSMRGQGDFFAIFSNTPRLEFMKTRIKFDKLVGRHLIVTATDFVFAQARAFYASALMDDFKTFDLQRAYEDQRLAHCGSISSQDELLIALAASSAIPLAFPPIEIEYSRYGQKVRSYFVDGGVGNNVPTREAAYFLRFLEDTKKGIAGETYCIKLSPSRIAVDELGRDFLSILARAYDVYDFIHMNSIVASWHRINREVDRWQEKSNQFNGWLEKEIHDPALRQKIADAAATFMPRQHKLPMLEIEPSASLGGTLDFSAARIRANIKMGHDDALNALAKSSRISEAERVILVNNFTLPSTMP
jgi:patatin-like phospholipase